LLQKVHFEYMDDALTYLTEKNEKFAALLCQKGRAEFRVLIGRKYLTDFW